MLEINEKHLESIVSLANKNHPVEACGVIAAKCGERESHQQRFIAMSNAADSSSFFEFDPKEQLNVWREMDQQEEYPKVIFHSHTASIAYPSRTDIEYASEPDSHYLIVSTDASVDEKYRSFRIFDGVVVEENIRVVKD